MVLSDFKQVQAVVLDVDGVLTDGSLLVNEQGDQLRTFHVRDGFAIKHAIRSGLQVWVITNGRSRGVAMRMKGLGVEEMHSAVEDKLLVLVDLAERYDISLDTIMYVGDDMPDLLSLQRVGLPVCPYDAAEEVKAVCRYISPFAGGKGAVRDVLEKVLKLQGKWPF